MDNFASNNPQDNRKATGFTNLNKYLGANSNNNLDQYIGGKISDQGNTLKNQVQDSQTKFQSGLDQQNQGLKEQQSNVSNVLAPYNYSSQPSGTATTTNQAQQQFTPPTDQQVSQFHDYMNPSYKGPSGLENYNQLQQQANDLSGLRTQYQGANPRDILQRYLGGNKQYTAGQQNLDSAMLGKGSNIRQALTSLGQVNPNALQSMNAGNEAASANIRSQQQDAAKQLRAQLGVDQNGLALSDDTATPGLLQNMNKSINTNLQNAQTTQQEAYNRALSQLQSGDPSSVLGQYGASLGPAYSGPFQERSVGTGARGLPGQTQSLLKDTGLWGVDPTKYFAQGNAPTASSVTSADQQAQMNALQKLAGQQLTSFDQGQAGSFNSKTPNTFDASGFNSAINKANTSYNTMENGIKNQIDQADNVVTKTQLIDQLNAIRSSYGLVPVTNPYVSFLGANVGPVINPASKPINSTPQVLL